ncbi:MAG TPA: contractile injection system tape measure protein [Cytophagaceae bacterium]|nr:contractile injection system tape measure protein [Cytophagaceae bacterium]
MSQQHVIKKLVMDLFVQKQKEAMKIQDNMISVAQHELVDIVEKVFSHYSIPDRMIEIDRLELNLGEIRADNLIKELSEKLSEKLANEFYKKGFFTDNFSENVVPEKLFRSEQTLFVYFLKNGILPWWNEEKVSMVALFDKLMEERRKEFVKAILTELLHEKSLVRFILQFSDDKIILFFASAVSYRFQSIRNFLTAQIPPAVHKLSQEKPVQARLIIWKSVVGYLKANNFSGFIEEELESVIHQTIESKAPVNDFSAEAIKLKRQAQEKRSREEKNKEQKDNHTGEDYRTNNTDEQGTPEDDFSIVRKKNEEKNAAQEKEFDNAYYSKESSEAPSYMDEEIYIGNAGLVLYWPYLTAFFRALDLLEQNDFKDLLCRNKAICVLHYLANSQEPAEEHLLFFNKVLCGWQPEESLQLLELTATEKEEADHLTAAVIEHWKALKNTSPDGLKETFIQRPGILIFKEGSGWKLRVEKKGVDVLMGALPWGFSMVKLPWMEHTLHVEW